MEGNEYINWGDKQQQQNGSLQQPPSLPASTPDPQATTQRHYWHDEPGIDTADGILPQNSFLSTTNDPAYSSYGVPEHQRTDDYSQQMLHMSYASAKPSAPSMSPPLVDQSNYAILQQQSLSHEGYSGAIDMSSTNSSQGYPQTHQSASKQTNATQHTNHQQVPQQQHQHLQPHHVQPHVQQTTRQIPEAQVRAPLPNPYQYANNALFRSAYNQNPYQGYNPNAYGHPMSAHHAQHVQSPASMTPYNPGQHMNTMNPQMQYSYQPLSNGYNPYPSNEEIALHNTPQYYQDRVNSMPQAQYYSHQNVKAVYPPAQIKVGKPAKSDAPSSPPRPTDAIQALRYDVSHCLDDYNTSRDLKGCAAALLAIMGTCDQVISLNDERSPSVSGDKSSVTSSNKDTLDPKIKQVALLSVVSSQIKGNMIEEVSKNKSIRAKLRTWFVRAHKDNSYAALKATIAVLDKLSFLNEQLLAEVKFGKALLIVSRKCEDQEVKDSLEKWIPKAQKSLEVEEELNKAASKAPPIEEEPKTKKAKTTATSVSTKSSVNADLKKNAKGSVTAKKVEPVAKLNTAFFKKETPATPAKVATIAKPGVLSVLNSIKVKKRVESEKELDPVKTNLDAQKHVTPSAHQAPSATVTPAFSALKFVETLKRGVSPNVTTDSQPETKKRKQKKRVSWKPDNDLEQIRLFETVESEDGDGDVAHTPHEYGNARDLDRKEGALLHGGVMHDREEDFLDWETPRVIDFSHKDLVQGASARGPKKAGSLIVNSIESDRQSAKEQEPEVTYASISEIPWSPAETHTDVESPAPDSNKIKIIPLPAELREHPRVQQILGRFAHITSEVLAEPEESLAFISRIPVDIPPPPPSGGSDIAAILASIAAAQQAASAKTVGSMSSGPFIGAPGHSEANSSAQLPLSSLQTSRAAETTHTPGQTAALPPLPLANLDPKLAEVLKSLAAQNGGMLPLLPPPPSQSAAATMGGPPLPLSSLPGFNQHSGSGNTNSSIPLPMPMPMSMPIPIPMPMTDIRPWVTINTGGKYREPCRFIGLGKCEKGDACPYIHPQN